MRIFFSCFLGNFPQKFFSFSMQSEQMFFPWNEITFFMLSQKMQAG